MSGIIGYFSSIPRQQEIMQIVKTMEYTIGEVKASDISLACHLAIKTSEKNEIIIQYEKNGYIIFCGEIFNEDIPDPKHYILDLYTKGDLKKLQTLNGSFLVAIYDNKNQKLTLINDRFGSKKLFYYYDKNNFFFSPKIAPLMTIAVNKKIRKESLIDFLIFGFYLENKTFDEHIFQLSPASILEITKDGISLKKYWSYQCDGNFDTRKQDVLIDELGIRWQNAINKRMKKKEKIIVQISGGLDSRAILAAALKSTSKENIVLYTFGEKGSYDFDIGTGIAQTQGIQQVSFHPVKENFSDQYLKSFTDSEGMIDATPYFPLQMIQPLKQFSSKIYNGYMGGEIMGPLIFKKIKNSHLQTDSDYEKAKRILLNHHQINNENTVKQLFNPSYLKDMPILSSFEDSIKDLQEYSTKEFPNYCARWMYVNESDKYTSFCNFRFNNQFHYYKPFLDNDIVDFMSRIPPDLRTEKRLYKKMLLKKYSELFQLPTKNTLGLTLQTNHLVLFNKRVWAFIQRKFNTILNNIGKPNLFFNKNENYIDYDDFLRSNQDYRDYIKSLLDKVKMREFFNPEYIDTLWNLHLKGKKNYSKLFGLLVTIEMVLEKYYDKPSKK